MFYCSFVFTALHCMHAVFPIAKVSVRLSVRPSHAWIVTKRKQLAKKVQLWLIGSRLRAFQWANDEQRTLPLTPKEASKAKICSFSVQKMGFSRRKSATKFLCMKTFSGQVVKHSLAYLTVHKWLVGDVPFDLKYWAKVTLPLQKRRLPIDILL